MKHLLIASALLAFAPAAAFAQSSGGGMSSTGDQSAQATTADPAYDSFEGPRKGTREVTLNGSGASGSGLTNNSFGITGSYGWYQSKALLFSVRQSINWADSDKSSSSTNGSTRVAADYHFNTNGRLRPFIGANTGYIYGDGVQDSWEIGPEVGVKYYVNKTTFLLAQTEYQFHTRNDFKEGSWVHTVGLGFNF